MTKGALLFVSYHFYPSPEVGAKRPSETALYLRNAGYHVTVLHAVDSRTGKQPKQQVDCGDLDGLQLISIAVPPKPINAIWKKLKEVFGRTRNSGEPIPETKGSDDTTVRTRGRMTVLRWLRRQLQACDAVFNSRKLWIFKSAVMLYVKCRRKKYGLVIASGPPIPSYICGLIASRLTGAPLLLDLRDPWYLHGDEERKDVAMILGHPLANLENSVGQRCIASSSEIIAASPGIRAHTLDRFAATDKPIHVIRNGFDSFARIDELPPHGKLRMLYAGTLYWNRNPFPFLEALGRVLAQPEIQREKVRLKLVGDCYEWNGIALQPWILKRELQDVVEIAPFASRDVLAQLMAECNVLLNFAQGQPRQIPAKSYEYLAAGRSVVVVAENDSDVAELYREAGVGEIVEPNDSASLAAIIGEMYERHVVRIDRAEPPNIAIQNYSRTTQLLRFEQVVQRIIAGSRIDIPQH